MELGLAALPFFVDRILLLIAQFRSKLLHAALIILNHVRMLSPHLSLVLVLQFSNLIFVPLDDSLDFWLKALYCLCSDLMDLFFLPLFFSDLLSGHPSILVLFKLDGKTVVDDLLLSFDCLLSSLDRFE